MKKVVLNIGLNIGEQESRTQLSRTLTFLLEYFVLDSVRVEEVGVYKGSNKRTLVVYFEADILGNLLETVCWKLSQEAIAYKIDGEGRIAFNPWYNGEQFPFDQQFFID